MNEPGLSTAAATTTGIVAASSTEGTGSTGDTGPAEDTGANETTTGSPEPQEAADQTSAAAESSPLQSSSPHESPRDTSPRQPQTNATPSHRKTLVIVASILLVGGMIALLANAGPAREVGPANEAAGTTGTLPPSDTSALPVNTVRVGSVAAPVLSQRYAGLLISRKASDLSFERGGRVIAIHVEEGSVVEQGELLAELDQDDLDAAEHRTKSELAAAQAVLDELVAGPREETIRAAAAKVEELTARVKLAEIDADRQRQLAPKGATSRSELDSAEFGLQATQNSLLAAQASLDELNEGTRKEQIAAKKAKCEAIEASLREIEAQRRDSKIVAPFAGTIGARQIDEGVVVSSGSTVLSLVSDAVEAQVGLPPATAGSLKQNEKVTVWLRDQQRDAWVDRSEPIVRRETRTRVVFLRFHPDSKSPAGKDGHDLFTELAGQGWVAGEVVEMQTRLGSEPTLPTQFWLPRSALVRGARGLWSVLVIPGKASSGVCERRALEILKTDGELALVQGMLDANERVISDGLHRVTAGMNVTSVQSGESLRNVSEKTR